MREITLKAKKGFFPVRLRDEETNEVLVDLKFDYTDDNIKNFREGYPLIEKKLGELDKKSKTKGSEDDFLEDAKTTFGYAFDFLLGDGAFDEIYSHCPSVLDLFPMLFGLVEGIQQGIDAKNKENEEAEANNFKIK